MFIHLHTHTEVCREGADDDGGGAWGVEEGEHDYRLSTKSTNSVLPEQQWLKGNEKEWVASDNSVAKVFDVRILPLGPVRWALFSGVFREISPEDRENRIDESSTWSYVTVSI